MTRQTIYNSQEFYFRGAGGKREEICQSKKEIRSIFHHQEKRNLRTRKGIKVPGEPVDTFITDPYCLSEYCRFLSVTVFFPQRYKMGPQKASLVYDGVFGHFLAIPGYFKIFEDYRRLTKISEDYRRRQKTVCLRFPRTNPKIFDFLFVVIFTWERKIFCSLQIRFFFREGNPSNSL